MLKARKIVREIHDYHSPLSSPSITLRLDMNESTTGCSPRVLEKLRNLSAANVALYPRRESGEKLVAEHLGLQSSELMLTNGADEAIDLLCRTFINEGDEAIVVVPAFAMYEVFAKAAGAAVLRIPAGPEFAFPLADVLKAITPRTRLVVITNPNNPTGTAVHRADILKIAAAAPDAVVLTDEAYFDFYGETVLDQVGKLPNLFVARTFSKAYGLAGIRLGVMTGPAEHIAMLKRISCPFNINAFALAALSEALADREFVAAFVKQIRTNREWMRRKLELLGLKVWPSHTNFLLVRLGPQKKEVLEALRSQGISLRDRPDVEGCVRITIGSQEEMEKVLAALKQIMAAQPVGKQASS